MKRCEIENLSKSVAGVVIIGSLLTGGYGILARRDAIDEGNQAIIAFNAGKTNQGLALEAAGQLDSGGSDSLLLLALGELTGGSLLYATTKRRPLSTSTD